VPRRGAEREREDKWLLFRHLAAPPNSKIGVSHAHLLSFNLLGVYRAAKLNKSTACCRRRAACYLLLRLKAAGPHKSCARERENFNICITKQVGAINKVNGAKVTGPAGRTD
jgi:hypothetical protein